MKFVTRVIMEMSCQRCGAPVEVWFLTDHPTQQIAIMHDGCDRPLVSMLCDNPRKLGVVTATT